MPTINLDRMINPLNYSYTDTKCEFDGIYDYYRITTQGICNKDLRHNNIDKIILEFYNVDFKLIFNIDQIKYVEIWTKQLINRNNIPIINSQNWNSKIEINVTFALYDNSQRGYNYDNSSRGYCIVKHEHIKSCVLQYKEVNYDKR